MFFKCLYKISIDFASMFKVLKRSFWNYFITPVKKLEPYGTSIGLYSSKKGVYKDPKNEAKIELEYSHETFNFYCQTFLKNALKNLLVL